MFLEICWRDNSHIEFHPARCALRVVSHCLYHRRFTHSGWFVSTPKWISIRFSVARWGCLCLAAASATVETSTYTFWSFMIKGPLIIAAAISMVKGYVFQPHGCANPSRQQSFTIPEDQTATGAAICWMEKNSLVLSGRRTHTNLTAVISLRCVSATGKCLTSCQGCKSKP